jgi:hypothetical protein
MSPRPDLLVLAAELEAHLARARRELVSIERLASDREIDERTLWALAGHLQALYTGWETIIRRVLEKFDGLPDEGPDSHVRLLQQSILDVPTVRPPILRPETAADLHPYRAFRHFFRHAYGVDLEWNRMASKVESAGAVLASFEGDVRQFIAFLQAAAAAERQRG